MYDDCARCTAQQGAFHNRPIGSRDPSFVPRCDDMASQVSVLRIESEQDEPFSIELPDRPYQGRKDFRRLWLQNVADAAFQFTQSGSYPNFFNRR